MNIQLNGLALFAFLSVPAMAGTMTTSANLNLADSYSALMLGGLSLIAFLSSRNTHLGQRTREVTDRLKDLDPESKHLKVQEWELSYLNELAIFLNRYKWNSYALQSAILGVFFFGVMIASPVVTGEWEKLIYSGIEAISSAQHVAVFAMCAGGSFATIAAILSIVEVGKGRYSLSAHVMYTIQNRTFCCRDEEFLKSLYILYAKLTLNANRFNDFTDSFVRKVEGDSNLIGIFQKWAPLSKEQLENARLAALKEGPIIHKICYQIYVILDRVRSMTNSFPWLAKRFLLLQRMFLPKKLFPSCDQIAGAVS